MRIAIDYTPALRQGAGIGRYTRGLVTALAKLDRSNEYTLLCFGKQLPSVAMPTWPDNFRFRTIQVPARWLTIVWHRLGVPLPAELLAGACDLYHSPDFTLPPLRRARGVVTVHDLSFMTVPECADPGLRAFLTRSVPPTLLRAQRILADSASTQGDLVRLLGTPDDKISIVVCGVEERFHRVVDGQRLAAVLRRYGLPERFVLTVGTLEPRKNHTRLIQAFHLLKQQMPGPHKLVIAGGKGWLFDTVLEQVDKAGLSDQVLFPGYVADEDLPALYSAADLFVFPSLYEGFGLPPLEALACGTPVVAADNSSLPDALGDAALLIDATHVEAMAAAMLRLLRDGDLCRHLTERGVAQAARFTWPAAARSLLHAYERTAAAPTPVYAGSAHV